MKPTGGGAPRHFLELMDLDAGSLRHMLDRACRRVTPSQARTAAK